MRAGWSRAAPGTLYHDAMLHYWPGMDRPFRQTLRELWFRQALQATADADLVCVDPDNGLAPNEKMFHQDGPKFVYMGDLRTFWNRGQSLVVYQHLGMNASAEVQIDDKATLLRGGLPGAEPIPLRYRHGSSRVFFVLPQPTHRERIEERIARMLGGPWGQHGYFERSEVRRG